MPKKHSLIISRKRLSQGLGRFFKTNPQHEDSPELNGENRELLRKSASEEMIQSFRISRLKPRTRTYFLAMIRHIHLPSVSSLVSNRKRLSRNSEIPDFCIRKNLD
jgi:hypothetical protein